LCQLPDERYTYVLLFEFNILKYFIWYGGFHLYKRRVKIAGMGMLDHVRSASRAMDTGTTAGSREDQ
jgi:hypothetical protein